MLERVTRERSWQALLAVLLTFMVFALLATSTPAQARSTSKAKALKTAVAKPHASPAKNTKTAKRKAAPRKTQAKRRAAPVVMRPSFGELQGLRATDDPLSLKSSVALVLDQETHEVLFDKNAGAVLPIASLTKLMTSLVVIEAGQPLDEVLTITQADVDTEKGSGSRLSVGTQLTRGEMLHLALMSSENRAASALGRHYPGGLRAFVSAMNAKAQLLGMSGSRFVEPTGLSSANRSSARDLAVLVEASYAHPLIRELSVSEGHAVAIGQRTLQFRNTNGLVRNPSWDIGLQKTGYISEAGRCLVMQAQLAGRKLIMVFLDSTGRYSRIGDAERVRRWIEETTESLTPTTAELPKVTS